MHFRKPFFKLALILSAGLLTVGLGGPAYAQGSYYKSNTITIGYINWTEDVAVSHLMQAVLEKNFDIEVKLKLVGTKQAFHGVATGKLDAFLDVWLPKTHAKYWAKYKEKVDDLGVWYQGVATLGIGVPNYVEAQTIGDLAKHVKAFDGKIIGIQPNSGVMQITKTR